MPRVSPRHRSESPTPRRRARRSRLAFASGLAFSVAALGAFLARDDWNWARPLAGWAVTGITDRRFAIDGDLRVDLGRVTAVEAHGVRWGNAPWGQAPETMEAKDLSLGVRLWPLLRGRLRLEELVATEVTVALERDAHGRGNWQFGSGSDHADDAGDDEDLIVPRRLLLRAIDLTVVDPVRPPLALRIDRLESKSVGTVHRLIGSGRYQGEPLQIEASLDGLPLADAGSRALEARATVGSTRVSAKGRLDSGGFAAGSTSQALDVELRMKGNSLNDLWRLLGLPLPHSPPFSLAGRLTYGAGVVRLGRFAGRLGNSDLEGDLAVHLASEAGSRQRIVTAIRSRAVDFDDIEGFWGKPPREEKAIDPVPVAGSPRSILPDVPFDLTKLRVADATILFSADRVQGKSVFEDVQLVASLDRGRLQLRPLRLGMAAGSLEARGLVDASGPEPRFDGEMVLRRVDLSRLLERTEVAADAGGVFAGRADLTSHGRSLGELARHLDGKVGVVLENGWISDEFLELAALHLGGFIRAKLDRDEPGPIRCLVATADAKDGLFTSRALLLDTRHVRIDGEAEIDLVHETLDIELRQHSKHVTIGALRTPVVIRGPLATRAARLKPGPLVARGGVAAALGAAVHPLAALLALIDPGRDDQPGACAEALEDYRPIAAGVFDRDEAR